MQLQVHLHYHLLCDTTSAQNARKSARPAIHVLGLPNIALLTNIRFHRRSTASPILSHFHALLRLTLQLQRLDSVPVRNSIYHQMLKSQISFRTFSSREFQASCVIWVSVPTVALWFAQERTGAQRFKDHLLYIKASFMRESALFGVCASRPGLLFWYWSLDSWN